VVGGGKYSGAVVAGLGQGGRIRRAWQAVVVTKETMFGDDRADWKDGGGVLAAVLRRDGECRWGKETVGAFNSKETVG